MIEGRTVLAIVPARGGSKGLPRKNIRPLAGKPLIAWTLECASQSRYIDRCIVSTDDPEIADVAREWGGDVPFLRPAELARDDTPGIAPVIHALEQIGGYDLVVLLQPTSPLRAPSDIDGCLEKLTASGAPACVSVTPADQSPYWMYTLTERGKMRPVLEGIERAVPRQQLLEVYVLNGAVYAAEVEWLKKSRSFLTEETVAFVMPRERSVDIDTLDDFERAERKLTTA